jgi:hypothetical protein
MPIMDTRGCPVTGASPRALEHFESALAEFQLARGDPLVHLGDAIAEAPEFAMARIFETHLCLGGRDPAGVDAAARILGDIAPGRLSRPGHFAALAAQSPATGRERAARERAPSTLGRWLRWRTL